MRRRRRRRGRKDEEMGGMRKQLQAAGRRLPRSTIAFKYFINTLHASTTHRTSSYRRLQRLDRCSVELHPLIDSSAIDASAAEERKTYAECQERRFTGASQQAPPLSPPHPP